MGGQSEALGNFLTDKYSIDKQPDLAGAAKLADDAFMAVEGKDVPPEQLEVAVLDRNRPRRKFRRLSHDEVRGLL